MAIILNYLEFLRPNFIFFLDSSFRYNYLFKTFYIFFQTIYSDVIACLEEFCILFFASEREGVCVGEGG